MPGPHYDADAFLEDAEWLAQTGAGFHETARRLNLSPVALEKRLRVLHRTDLLSRLGGYTAVRQAQSA